MRRFMVSVLWLLIVVPVFAASEALPFLHDDYASALSQAKARKLPIFVEVSAPW
jgi:hypothetical protein